MRVRSRTIQTVNGRPFDQEQPACVLLDARSVESYIASIESLYRFYAQVEPLLRPPLVAIVQTDESEPSSSLSSVCSDFSLVPETTDEVSFGECLRDAVHRHRSRIENRQRLKVWLERYRKCSPRQQQVARMLLQGRSNKWIASRLAVSGRTVEVDRSNLFQTMGVENAIHLAGVLTELRLGGLLDTSDGTASG